MAARDLQMILGVKSHTTSKFSSVSSKELEMGYVQLIVGEVIAQMGFSKTKNIYAVAGQELAHLINFVTQAADV